MHLFLINVKDRLLFTNLNGSLKQMSWNSAKPYNERSAPKFRTRSDGCIWRRCRFRDRIEDDLDVAVSGKKFTARGGHTATLLPNGKLLVAGGQTACGFTSSSTEIYDPADGTWTMAGSMNSARAIHTATMPLNGRVLVAGGHSSISGGLSSAELYEPFAGTWTNAGLMSVGRFLHTATLLPDGQVLVVGGTLDGSNAISKVELYDPATATWTATNSLGFARFSRTATIR